MKKKVLLAEDDRFIARAYEAGLERAGFDMLVVYDGKEAMNIIKREKPDIVLLDLVMPIKNGFEVLEEIQLDETLQHIPVVVLSNLGQESDIKKGTELGAVDYLVKSDYSMKEVIEKVKENLVRRRTS
jgi:DNA-binding response OmpR family regulator